MQESIEQSIGLTIAGNAFLQGHDIGSFWPDSPIFAVCDSVRFVEASPRVETGGEKLVAPDPLAWFRSLAKDCIGLQLHAVGRRRPEIADWMDVGLVGGGSVWLLESVGGPTPSIWFDTWAFSEGAAAGDRPWSVTYNGAPPTGLLPAVAPDLDQVEQDLAAALVSIAAFARRIGSHFASFFSEALAIIERRTPPDGFDLVPNVPGFLSPQAERILGACRMAWVFGGMGAWNDGAYEGAQGDRLTADLFDRLQRALAAAASSTCAG